MDFSSAALIGFFLGFAFGVGCALAVMYSIYMGGYRAAVKEMQADELSERLKKALAKLAGARKKGSADERP